jgi:integrase
MPKQTKFPVVRSAFPRVIDYTATKLKSYMLDARKHDGKREYFVDAAEAKTRAEEIATTLLNRGLNGLNFSAQHQAAAEECLELLRPFNRSLRDATLHFVDWLRNEETKRNSLFVHDCVEHYIVAREADAARGDLAKSSLKEIRMRTRQLSASLGGLHVAELDGDKVKGFLDSIPYSARTRQNVRLRLSKFFNFCKSKKWIASNPCEEITIKVARGDTQILSAAVTQALLTKCEESEFKAVVTPYTALCLYAGLRPGEAEQIAWEQIDFVTRSIHVLSHTSKRRESRFVEMDDALIDWLTPYAKEQGRVVGPNFRKQFESVKIAAGFNQDNPWVADIMRHSYASYWLELHKNRAQLGELMGTSADMIRKHYRKVCRRDEALRYWGLRRAALV